MVILGLLLQIFSPLTPVYYNMFKVIGVLSVACMYWQAMVWCTSGLNANSRGSRISQVLTH